MNHSLQFFFLETPKRSNVVFVWGAHYQSHNVKQPQSLLHYWNGDRDHRGNIPAASTAMQKKFPESNYIKKKKKHTQTLSNCRAPAAAVHS